MMFDLDIAIVIGFLLINLGVGLYFGSGVNSIKEYAVANRNISTTVISASVIATWISGSFFTVSVSQTYKDGIWFIPAALGDIISLLVISYFLAPKMQSFLKDISVAESIGRLYGTKIRLITAIASLAQAIAMTALQIKIFSSIFSYFLSFSVTEATIISSFVVIFYSSWGGIKAVTFTDVLQFFTFGILIPMFALFIWHKMGNTETIIESFNTNPLLDFSQLTNYENPRFWPNFTMMVWFMIPSLNSPTFQRVLMAKNTKQINASFNIAAIGYTFIMMFVCMIGLLLLSLDPSMHQDNIVVQLIDTYSFTGLKGITLIGIMAMVMSTADSWINVGSVIFTHDICRPLGTNVINELLLSRISAILIGFASVSLVLFSPTLFQLFSLQANFYMPIVTMPLMFAILGFRTTRKSVAIGMISGALTVVLWKIYLTPITSVDSVVPAMFANLFAFMTAHYLLRQKGGWLRDLDTNKKKLKKKTYKFTFESSEIISYLNSHLPKDKAVYFYFAFGSLLTLIVTFSLDNNVYKNNSYIVNSLQIVALFISTIFFTRDTIWPEWLKKNYTGIIWYCSIFVSLSLISSLMLYISHFSEISLVVFIVHLSMIGILLNWRTTLLMIILGMTIG